MARPRRLALLAAVALGALAALLLGLSDGPRRAGAAVRPPAFRHSLRAAEIRRLQERRSLPPAPGAAEDPYAAGPQKPPRRDPFLVALPTDSKQPLVVLEANALRHSRLGELFVDCLFSKPGEDPLKPVRELGFDPLKDLDRVAVSSRGVVASGFFERARLDKLAAATEVSSYGDAGRVYASRAVAARDADADPVLGTWGANTLVFGERPFVEQTIDRLEGRAPEAPPVIPESLTYGEAYGVVSGEALTSLFGGAQAGLGRKLAEVASRIELHADAMRDVAISARISGPDERAVEDLGSTLGAAMAVARLQARASGDDALAQLLEYARVVRGSGEFHVELAIPVDVLEGWFAGCGERPARAAR